MESSGRAGGLQGGHSGGTIVGYNFNPTIGGNHGFILNPDGTSLVLATQTQFRGISDNGTIAGWSDAGAHRHAITYTGGVLSNLPDLGFGSAAYALNNSRIVGNISLASSDQVATYWDATGKHMIGPNGSFSGLFAINQSNLMGGFVDEHAALFSQTGTMTLLPSLAAGNADQVLDISNDLIPIAVGVSGGKASEWISGAVIDLNSLLSVPDKAHWQLLSAQSIDGNTIVGRGLFNGVSTSFRLSPRAVPEPSAILLLAFGVVGMGFVAHRRR